MESAVIVHFEHPDGRIACTRVRADLVKTADWNGVTCEDCLYARHQRRKGLLIGGLVAAATIIVVGVCSLAVALGDTEEAGVNQTEIDQTIVAQGIKATLESMEQTRTYPTRQIEEATRAVTNTQTAHAAVAEATRRALQSARATREAPAPYSVHVKGLSVICREIAYEYLYMADLGKVVALQHVATTISLASNNSTLYISAHDAENALAECQCFSTRNCKPID